MLLTRPGSKTQGISNIKVFNLFYNLEIRNENVAALLVAKWLYDNKRVIVDVPYLFGRNDATDKLDAIIQGHLKNDNECKDFIDYVSDNTAIFTRATKDKIVQDIESLYANSYIIDESGQKKILPVAAKGETVIVQVIIDHIGLVTQAKGETAYEVVKGLSTELFRLRNKFPLAPIVIQQVTQEKMNFKGKDRTIPDIEGLYGSKTTFQDSDVAICIGSPLKAGFAEYLDYKVKYTEEHPENALMDRLRIIYIQKNRGGTIGNPIACLFLGEFGRFAYIDHPEQFNYTTLNNFKRYKKQ